MTPSLIDSCHAVVEAAYAAFKREHEIPVLAIAHNLVGTVLSHATANDPMFLRAVMRRWRDTMGAALQAGLKGGQYQDFLDKLTALWTLTAGPDLKLVEEPE